ncbi:MAG: hypothetical protein GY778_19945 [bacterium]|nr:hypothetical protein [bacterium]
MGERESSMASTPDPGVCDRCGRPAAVLSAASCPECGGPIVPQYPPKRRGHRIGWLSLPPMRYPTLYVWFVFLAAMDLLLTGIVLRVGGREVNAVAADVLHHRGLTGMIIFKFSLVLLIIVMCEVIGRRRDQAARRLAKICIAVTAIPIVAAFAQLWMVRGELPQRLDDTGTAPAGEPVGWYSPPPDTGPDALDVDSAHI